VISPADKLEIAMEFSQLTVEETEYVVESQKKKLRRQNRMETWSLLVYFSLSVLNLGYSAWAYRMGEKYWWITATLGVYWGWMTKKDADKAFISAKVRNEFIRIYEETLEARRRVG